jgi:hypothetical protein
LHQWHVKCGKRTNYINHYKDWLFGRRTLAEIAAKLDISYPTLTQEFDKIIVPEGVQCAPPAKPLNLLIDATFFGREYGFLCFHDTTRIIYFHEIKTETTADLRTGLLAIKEAGFRVKSFTIDGRRGYIQNIRKIFGNVPIQMCIFHQKAIVRRYITDKPKSACGKALKTLMETLCYADQQEFIDRFYGLAEEYRGFLEERNEKGGYRHGKLRAAFRSMQENMPLIFTYKDIPSAEIPSTTGRLEGLFSHLKLNITIHRGLSKIRKKIAAKFFLKYH